MEEAKRGNRNALATFGMLFVAALHWAAITLFVPMFLTQDLMKKASVSIPDLTRWLITLSQDVKGPTGLVLVAVAYAVLGFVIDLVIRSGKFKYLLVMTFAVLGLLAIVLGTLMPLYSIQNRVS